MAYIEKKKLAYLSVGLSVSLILLLMIALNIRETTGMVASETASETMTLGGLFVVIGILAGLLTFITIIYRQEYRY